MDFEERERQRKRQFIKVMIAEIGMVIAVIAIVVVSTLASMGFFVTSSGNIEQSGLVQIHSMPTGGSVELDGAVLFSRTNLSRSLTPGEHSLKITKEGYDGWAKTVKIYSGLLVRLYYPRLFLLDRKAESVMTLGQKISFYSIADDYTNTLYAEEKSAVWTLLSIKGSEVQRMDLNLTEILPGVKEVDEQAKNREKKKEFTGKVEEIQWSKDNDYVLIRVFADEKQEWILLNLKNLGESLNLTKIFGLNFEKIEMIDGVANQLFALENGHLRKIKTSDQSISRVLLDGMTDFMSNGASLIYKAEWSREVDGEKREEQVVGVYRDGEKAGTVIARLERDANVQVGLSEYYGESYMVYIVGNLATVYYGTIPSYRENAIETDFGGTKVLVEKMELAAEPKSLEVSADGEYFLMKNGERMMVIDVDMGDLYEYEIEGDMSTGWLNEAMMYGVKDGGLTVWDFDNTNRRELVEKVAIKQERREEPEAAENLRTEKTVTTKSSVSVAQYPVMVSSDEKWLYYLANLDNGKIELRREKVRD